MRSIQKRLIITQLQRHISLSLPKHLQSLLIQRSHWLPQISIHSLILQIQSLTRIILQHPRKHWILGQILKAPPPILIQKHEIREVRKAALHPEGSHMRERGRRRRTIGRRRSEKGIERVTKGTGGKGEVGGGFVEDVGNVVAVRVRMRMMDEGGSSDSSSSSRGPSSFSSSSHSPSSSSSSCRPAPKEELHRAIPHHISPLIRMILAHRSTDSLSAISRPFV